VLHRGPAPPLRVQLPLLSVRLWWLRALCCCLGRCGWVVGCDARAVGVGSRCGGDGGRYGGAGRSANGGWCANDHGCRSEGGWDGRAADTALARCVTVVEGGCALRACGILGALSRYGVHTVPRSPFWGSPILSCAGSTVKASLCACPQCSDREV